MRRTSPPLEDKLRYHRMRSDGLCESWAEYLQLRVKLNTPASRRRVDILSIDNYEPKKTAQEELGF